jgi:acyl-CoA thioesterase FadM
VALRFEDVTQDGRVVLEALPNALEPTVWRRLREDAAARACFAQGIVPILTRFVLEGTSGPFSPHRAVEARATWRIARSDAGPIVLDMWADLVAPIARTYGPQPPDAGSEAVVGRVYAEHVFTRPFAPAGQRRVTELDFEGAPVVDATRPALAPPESLAALPDGARPLDPLLSLEPTPLVFGLVHTDSNMHVNSLAYLRAFEEAALRRLASRGVPAARLGRHLEIAYRKPCFAGQVLRVVLQAYERGERLGAAGYVVDAADAAEPPGERAASAQARAVVRIELEA